MNKLESARLISQLGLNRLPKGIFYKPDPEEVKAHTKAEIKYNIRDLENPSGHFGYNLSREEVLSTLKKYPGAIMITESMYQYDKNNLILQGDILIKRENLKILASLDTRKSISNREAMKNPEYSLILDYAGRLPRIPGLEYVLGYIINYNLFDLIVEFSLYDLPVGLLEEPIIIWELRDSY